MSEKDVEIDIESGEILDNKVVVDHPDEDEDEDRESGTASREDDRTSTEPDTELDDAETDDEREAIRERRRNERKNRKVAQREREDSLRRELASRDTVINELRNKMDAFERRNTGSDMAKIEEAKQQTAKTYNFFKDQIRVATEAGNGAAVADATEKMIQAQRKFDELTSYERGMKQRQSAPQPLDPRLVNHAKQWMERNSWYDANAKDPDSRIVMSLDQQLAEEGWDPTTKEYWQELDTRTRKYLPHRVNRDKISSNKPRSVVVGSGRESAGPAGSTTYKLSADRVKALKEAGTWDDPKLRADAIKRYREYDKSNQG